MNFTINTAIVTIMQLLFFFKNNTNFNMEAARLDDRSFLTLYFFLALI